MRALRKMCSVVVILAMLVGFLPVGVQPVMAAEGTYNINSSSVTITGNGTYTINGSGNTTTNTITVNSGVTATITLSNVTIDCSETTGTALDIQSGANVTLILEGTNTLTGGGYDDFYAVMAAPGIHLPSRAALTIQGNGSLTVTGGDGDTNGYGGAGIGGNNSITGPSAAEACGTITILSGTVEVKGGGGVLGGVGIGGGTSSISGSGGAGGNVTIRDGSVTITGGIGSIGAGGTGIGGGAGFNSANGGAGGTVIITGGTVTVTGGNGGYGGAGIGGGASGSAGGDGGTVVILTPATITGGEGTGTGSIDDGVNIGGGQGSSDGGNGQGIRPTEDGENTYEVYGNLTLPGNIEIPSGVTVTIPSGSTLTIPKGVTVTNNGTLNNQGTIENYGTISGTVTGIPAKVPSTVSVNASSATVTYGSTVTLTATVTNGRGTNATDGFVTFYQGTNISGTPLNSGGATVTNGTATYELSLNSNNWTPSNNPYTITAVYSGGTGLLSGSSTAQLTVTKTTGSIAISCSDVVYGNSPSPSVVSTTNAGATVEYSYVGINDTSYGPSKNAPTEVGTYKVTATVAETATHTSAISEAMTFSITQSGSNLTATATDDGLTYGDTLTVTVTPSQTGQPPANNVLTPLAAGNNTVELYNGNNLLVGTSEKNDGGIYTLTYDTAGKGLTIGENTLTVKFNGDTNMAASSTTVTVNLSQKTVSATLSGTTTKTYDGTTDAPEGLTIGLSDVENGDDVSASGTIAYNSADVTEANTITASNITLSGDHAGYYSLSNTEATTSGTITEAQMTGTVIFDGSAVYDTPLTATYEGNATSVTYQWYRTERNGTITAISGATESTYTPTELDADRALYVIVTAIDTNHTGVVYSQSLTVGRLPGSITIGCADVTYGQTPSPYVVSNTNPEAPMWYTYTGRGDTVYAASRTPPTEAGTYSVSAYVEFTVTHSAATSNTVEFSILPADSSVTAPPAAVQDLVYTGQPQALVTAGTADGGTMVYSLDGETYTAELPTATDAGTYTVWYMVQGDKNHNNSTPASVEVTITKATPALTLSADRDTLSGGGRVVLTLSGLPEGESATVTGDHGITVTDNGDGTWTASLPNRTQTYTFTATVAESDNYEAATATTTVRVQSYIPPTTPSEPEKPSGPSTGDSDGWTSITDELGKLDPDTQEEPLTIEMNGETEVPKEVFETIAGKDVDVVFDMGDGVSWSVNGADIPVDADLSNLNLGVSMNTDGIPVDVINAITGEATSVQITLAHDGDFGFALTLSAPLGEENAGYWANLYHFDEDAERMDFETAALIDDDGTANLRMTHASQYAIVIDDHPHETVLPFTDVNAGDWFYDPVVWAYDNGLMTGTSATTFEPNTSTTRAMIVAILNRLEGGPTADGGTFTDVADGDWYADAVNWAASVGIVAGFEDGTFRPNAPITREQMAAILYNYAQWKGYDVSNRADLSRYMDAEKISTWAMDVVRWAVAEGLLTGVTEDTLAPQASATRAQVAAIFQRFLSE